MGWMLPFEAARYRCSRSAVARQGGGREPIRTNLWIRPRKRLERRVSEATAIVNKRRAWLQPASPGGMRARGGRAEATPYVVSLASSVESAICTSASAKLVRMGAGPLAGALPAARAAAAARARGAARGGRR